MRLLPSQAAACFVLLLAHAVCAQFAVPAMPPAPNDVRDLLGPLSDGAATVKTAQEFLQALEDGVGDITLAGDVVLTPELVSQFQTPIIIEENATIFIHVEDRSVGWNLRPGLIDWGSNVHVLDVSEGATLAFSRVISENPGNFTAALSEVPDRVRGSFIFPAVLGRPGHSVVFSNSLLYNDDPKCSPATTQAAVATLQQMLGPNGAQYMGGVKVFYPFFIAPLPVTDMSINATVGTAMLTYINVTNECFNSLDPNSNAVDSGGGGTDPWVWAVVGCGVAIVLLTAVGAAFLLRQRRRRRDLEQQQQDKLGMLGPASSLASSLQDPEAPGSASGGGSGGKLGSLGAAGGSGARRASLSGGSERQGSGGLGSGSGSVHAAAGLQNALMRTRFGVINDLQLGELLGRGAYGRVYKGRWKGVIVAVKVIEHRVQPGKTCDLSREPLLSMSVSHPNLVATHQMCVVRIISSNSDLEGGEGEGTGSGGLQLSGGGGSGSRGSGSLVRAFSGGDGLVELVSPHEVLQPGLFETWMVTEYADRGSLADYVSAGKLAAAAGPDPAQRNTYVLLCLLDIALGLAYLHSSAIVHGDLKPANVLLRSARNDRRGFVCKLGDFGLSRMLGQEETHVDTQSYGTPGYAAPELLSEGKLTQKADIYAFAMIIWELVTGTDLYKGMTAMQIIVQVSQFGHRPEVPSAESGYSAPPELLALMQRCWSQDAAQRPDSSMLVNTLRAMVAPLLQRPPSRQASQ